jgi:Fic family protein
LKGFTTAWAKTDEKSFSISWLSTRVKGHLAALRFISGNANKKAISEKDILRLHKIAGKDALDRKPLGEYRSYEVTVGNYTPPHPKEVPTLMALSDGSMTRDRSYLPS